MNRDFRPEEYVTEDIIEKYRLICDRVNEISKYSCRNLVLEILDNTELIVLNGIGAGTGRVLYDNGFIDNLEGFEEYFSDIKKRRKNKFISSPGSRMTDHHSYPGGLVYHTAANIELALGVADVYRRIYGLNVDRELLVIALAFHDIAKVSLLSWDNRGTYPDEYKIAGTEAHHILSMSEAILREFPFSVIKAMAFCHVSFDTPEKELEKYLTAAFLITGKNIPADYNLEPQVEDMICLFADSDVFIGKWAIRRSLEILERKGYDMRKIYGFLSSRTEYSAFNKEI